MRHAIRIGRSRRCGWRGRHLRRGHGRVARGPGCAPRLPLPAARVIVQRRRDMPLRWINGCAARDRAGCGAVGRPRGAIRARRALANDVAGRAIARFAQGQGIWRSLIGHASSPFPPQRARARPSIPCAARIGVAAAAPGSPLPPRPVHAPPRPAPQQSRCRRTLTRPCPSPAPCASFPYYIMPLATAQQTVFPPLTVRGRPRRVP